MRDYRRGWRQMKKSVVGRIIAELIRRWLRGKRKSSLPMKEIVLRPSPTFPYLRSDVLARRFMSFE